MMIKSTSVMVAKAGCWRKGVFPVKKKNAFLPVKRVHSVNTFKNFNCLTRE